MSKPANGLLTDLLRDVSRSFYLTLRVLPRSIRPQIGLAYLLARTTDTIADTQWVALGQRLEALDALRARILGQSTRPLNFGGLVSRQGSPSERVLLERSEEALGLLEQLPPPDLKLVRQVLDTITSGQELDLRRFVGASKESIVSLRTAEELDDYTYRVAGCVGEFWTRMCRAHVFPRAELDDHFLLENGVRFGKGLQLVNILRDLPADLLLGRCYLPAEELTSVNLTPQDLRDPQNTPRLRPVYNRHLEAAEAHLRAGWDYTNALPWKNARVRLACAWPVLIGFDTLRLLRQGNILDPGSRIKVNRSQIKRVMLRSILYYPWPAAWRRLPA